jgi:NADPH-dependent 2,4-dienoyl-CoA reductase/sulfur reductase-like enzyme
MALEVCRKIRAVVGSPFILGFRLSADEGIAGGITIYDVVAFVRMLKAVGVDYVSVSASTLETAFLGIPPMCIPRGRNLPFAAAIKKEVQIPVICAGGIDVKLGEEALKTNQVDLVAMGRGLIADPELPRKMMEGRIEDIRPCIRGNLGCMGRVFSYWPMSCEVNPGIGRDTAATAAAAVKKKVLVIGGGVGGMEAARLSSERGHEVVLVEKEVELGGRAIEASRPDFKKDIRPLVIWLKTQLEKLGVTVRLGTEATPEMVKQDHPEVLIIAVGSENKIPAGVTGDASEFIFPQEVLLGKRDVGQRVVVAGGGFVGCETALYVAEALGKDITIVAASDSILRDCEDMITRMALMARLEAAGARIRTGLELRGLSGGRVTFSDRGGGVEEIDADSVILAKGYVPREVTVSRFERLAPEVYKVGDCLETKTIFHAFTTARHAVLSIGS